MAKNTLTQTKIDEFYQDGDCNDGVETGQQPSHSQEICNRRILGVGYLR